TLRCFVHTPFQSRKRGRGVKNILSILQIQNRIARSRETPITRRQVNENLATISENLRWKSPVPPDCSRECVFGHETETLRWRCRSCPPHACLELRFQVGAITPPASASNNVAY